jgi:DNA-binding IscR family transcriptional regulator
VSSVSASAIENPQLFNEETGEVQPAAIAEQICSAAKEQFEAMSLEEYQALGKDLRPWYIEKLHKETGTSRQYCQKRLALLYRDGLVADDANRMCVVTEAGATALGVTNVPLADIPLHSFFTNNPTDTTNKFGHNRFNLRLDILYPLVKGKGGQPSLNVDAAAKLREWAHNPDKFPELTSALSVNDFWIRSDFIEKCALALQAILRRIDNATMIVGKPNKTGMRCWSVDNLAKVAGISKRGFERVLTRLYKSKLMTSARQFKEIQKNIEYEYYPSIRKLSEDFFKMLGFTEARIKASRDHKSKTIKAEAEQQGVKSRNMVDTPHKQTKKKAKAIDQNFGAPKTSEWYVSKASAILRKQRPNLPFHALNVEIMKLAKQLEDEDNA